MAIAFGHFPSVRFAVPRKDSLHLTARKPAYTARQSAGRRNGQPQGCSLRSHRLRRLKPLTPTLSPAVHSAMPSMLHCCTSDLNRRPLTALCPSAQASQLLPVAGLPKELRRSLACTNRWVPCAASAATCSAGARPQWRLDRSRHVGSSQRLPTTEGSQATSSVTCRSGSESNKNSHGVLACQARN
jgi:hypothetical protein